MNIYDEFSKWLVQIEPDLNHITGIMAKRLSDEPEELIIDLEDVEAWNSRVGSFLAEANSWLDRVSYEMKPPREEGTEFDRKLFLDNKISGIRGFRDRLESLESCIKQRLILGESILSYQKQFQEHKKIEPLKSGRYDYKQSDETPF